METIVAIGTQRGQAERRVRAYLQCLGIEDQDAIKRLTEQVLVASESSADPAPVEARALDGLFQAREIWIRALSGQGPSGCSDPLVGWRLRAMLQRHPDALLCEPSHQGADIATVATMTAVPLSHLVEMPAQPLGSVPTILRKSFWRGAAEFLKVLWNRFSRGFARE